ncbi:hypothetical protein EVAR_7974_1 [Eumeta japonica]|uniref:Secreted protein n=1 Tax=Eumeta variegata TaxID=151549 RepID=A0A4C1TJH7_EUMVA|nr:hypothetical protein EVAR_7974_1 [Eumeta japonica]
MNFFFLVCRMMLGIVVQLIQKHCGSVTSLCPPQDRKITRRPRHRAPRIRNKINRRETRSDGRRPTAGGRDHCLRDLDHFIYKDYVLREASWKREKYLLNLLPPPEALFLRCDPRAK